MKPSLATEYLAEFHAAMGDKPGRARTGSLKARQRERILRETLIEEEYEEVMDELFPQVDNIDVEKLAKELCDLLYVVYGTGHSFGLDLDLGLAEVHRANMEKDFDAPRAENGKLLKSEGYRAPDLRGCVS